MQKPEHHILIQEFQLIQLMNIWPIFRVTYHQEGTFSNLNLWLGLAPTLYTMILI
jgi:hypothetical protein